MSFDFGEVIHVTLKSHISEPPVSTTAPPRAEVTVYSPLFSPFRQPLDGEAVSIGRASACANPVNDPDHNPSAPPPCPPTADGLVVGSALGGAPSLNPATATTPGS